LWNVNEAGNSGFEQPQQRPFAMARRCGWLTLGIELFSRTYLLLRW